MSYVRVALIDEAPLGLGTYEWQVNYNEEEGIGSSREVEQTSTTDGEHFIVQQGEDAAQVFRLTGTILHENQYEKLTAYFKASRDRTIQFRDFVGDTYVVVMTTWRPQRVRAAKNPQDATIALHYYRYEMELHVVDALTGPWA